jgi:RND superfamily putative drug exporter
LSAVLDRLRRLGPVGDLVLHSRAAEMVSRDRHSTYLAISSATAISAKRRDLAAIAPLGRPDPVCGPTSGRRRLPGRRGPNQRDVERAEVLSLPVLLVLLLLIFRGLVAATVPLLVGVVATLGVHRDPRPGRNVEVSVFATNVITLLGSAWLSTTRFSS